MNKSNLFYHYRCKGTDSVHGLNTKRNFSNIICGRPLIM
ncbi:unnamed protein product, partial [Larinioides sclopetarius]